MRSVAVTVLSMLLAACGSGAGDTGAQAGDAMVNDTASPASPEVPQTAEEFLAEQAEQARRDSADFATRASSMSSYAECIRQARDLDSAAAASIRRACSRLPDAPR